MINTFKDSNGARKKYKSLGRGIGSGKGKTCARGGKGQTARSGVALAGFEGGQMPLYIRLPKRGFKSMAQKFVPVNLQSLAALVEAGSLKTEVTLASMYDVGIIKGKGIKVKILGIPTEGMKMQSIEAHAVSKSAQERLEKSGCKINLI